MGDIVLHPVQSRCREDGHVRSEVTLAAHEVYSHIYGPQEAMITGSCRGGFGTGELIAFLYARAFPKEEWNARVNQAFDGMKLK